MRSVGLARPARKRFNASVAATFTAKTATGLSSSQPAAKAEPTGAIAWQRLLVYFTAYNACCPP